MVFDVEITSKGMIKPSSPTPHHLRNLKLSFLDQMVPPFFEPMIFFYQADDQLPKDFPQLHQTLKNSLSLVLTRFYPLAGRFSKDNFTIDCNDSGTLFRTSKVRANLSELIRDPIMDDLEKLVPLGRFGSMSEDNSIVLAIQINLFDCGGIAIAVQLHHNCGDAMSCVTFMKAWAAAASQGGGNESDETPPPTFDLAKTFPPKDMSTSGYKPSTGVGATEKIVAKRFVFDKKQLEKLKQAETEFSQVKDPTRVEALTSFFFKLVKDVKGSKKSLGVVHTVNLRPKTDPPLSNYVFGNVWRHAVAIPGGEKGGETDLVAALRNAIKRLDGDYVKELQRGDEYLNNVKKSAGQYMKGELELWSFTSVCRLPVYGVDYGWGRPVWVSPGTFPSKNLVIFMSTSCGEGIEAWVHLLEEDAASMYLNLDQMIEDL